MAERGAITHIFRCRKPAFQLYFFLPRRRPAGVIALRGGWSIPHPAKLEFWRHVQAKVLSHYPDLLRQRVRTSATLIRPSRLTSSLVATASSGRRIPSSSPAPTSTARRSSVPLQPPASPQQFADQVSASFRALWDAWASPMTTTFAPPNRATPRPFEAVRGYA